MPGSDTEVSESGSVDHRIPKFSRSRPAAVNPRPSPQARRAPSTLRRERRIEAEEEIVDEEEVLDGRVSSRHKVNR